MIWEFPLKKMDAEHLEPVRYFLDTGDDFFIVNDLIDKKIKIEHTGYQCKICGSDEPVFRMGMCKKCFFESPYAGDWIVHPELSKAHLDEEDRDLEVEKAMQLQPHYVYLAHTSGIKVGVTRKEQIPNRWIDQGACEAAVIMETPNRYLAGITEVALKNHVNDKTDWRKMLTSIKCGEQLHEVYKKLLPHIPAETRDYLLGQPAFYRFTYPLARVPEKIKSLKLEKQRKYTGKLTGIKGQYLIFDDGYVFNIRNHEGYVVRWEV